MKLFLALSVSILAISSAHADGGYNGQCPELAGKYVEPVSKSPMRIMESVDGDVITYTYGSGSGGADDEAMVADGKSRDIDGAKITVTCEDGKLLKKYEVDGFQGAMVFERLDNGGVALDGQVWNRVQF